LSKDEIAAALGIGVPTVRNQIARAVRHLAEYFLTVGEARDS
jgi:DNA-directed RNA polymerase specialized sigma24 family protein